MAIEKATAADKPNFDTKKPPKNVIDNHIDYAYARRVNLFFSL